MQQNQTSKSNLEVLSSAERGLVRLMQNLNFGSVEGLVVGHGQPVLDPLPRRIRDLKFGADNGPRAEVALSDFALKREVTELIQALAEVGDGIVDRIEVRHGVPFRLTITLTAVA